MNDLAAFAVFCIFVLSMLWLAVWSRTRNVDIEQMLRNSAPLHAPGQTCTDPVRRAYCGCSTCKIVDALQTVEEAA